MKYYSYNEYTEEGGLVVTYSEEDIRREYWPYWYGMMCKKYEQAYVDENFSFLDCVEDWIATHWAWSVDNES